MDAFSWRGLWNIPVEMSGRLLDLRKAIWRKLGSYWCADGTQNHGEKDMSHGEGTE